LTLIKLCGRLERNFQGGKKMSFTYIPQGYHSKLNLYETQMAIGTLKRIFEENLFRALNLKRVSAPLFVDSKS